MTLTTFRALLLVVASACGGQEGAATESAAGGAVSGCSGACAVGGTASGGTGGDVMGGQSAQGGSTGGALLGQGGFGTGGTGATVQCLPRNDDPTGYLVKICEYLVANDMVFTDPNKYNIERIETRLEDGREVLWVFLDCCFMGDIAMIDPTTGTMIGFSPGDV